VKKVEERCQLSVDVLDFISKTLDFDDHFEFAAVCKNWRAFHKTLWRNFLASQEPLLLQIAYNGRVSCSFINIPNQKVYSSKMIEYFLSLQYVASSNEYFIMAEHHSNTLMLINPFTRIKKLINTPNSEINFYSINRALLAFDQRSEEFVLVILCKHRLHVYHSRSCGWVTYSIMENFEAVVDFVILHNIIYVGT